MKYTVLMLFFVVLFPIVVHSQQQKNNISIQIEPEKVVFLENESKKITVTLHSPFPLDIEIAHNRMYNIKVEAYDNLKLPVPFSTQFYYLQLHNTTPPYTHGDTGYTTVSLSQEKQYSFDIMLDNYLEFRSTGTFTITVRFFPHPFNNKSIQAASDPILISIVKDTTFFENTTQTEFGNENTHEGRISQAFYYPEDAVKKALQSAISTNWDEFFSTVDLYSFYLNIVQDTRQFNTLAYHQQRKELLSFIKNISYQEDYMFLIDTAFSIDEVQRTSTKATVAALVSKVYDNQRKEIRNYTFFLEKKANSWKIINIDITNIGIERITSLPKKDPRHANLDYLIPADFIEAE